MKTSDCECSRCVVGEYGATTCRGSVEAHKPCNVAHIPLHEIVEATKYAKATGTSKAAEPKQTARGQVPIASTQQGITAYQTKREFMNERNNPKFNVDPKFRNYVEQRMMKTDFTKLPK